VSGHSLHGHRHAARAAKPSAFAGRALEEAGDRPALPPRAAAAVDAATFNPGTYLAKRLGRARLERRRTIEPSGRATHEMSSPLPNTPLLDAPAFVRYRAVLAAWLDGRSDEHALYHASADVCGTIRSLDMQPEHILIALHATGLETRTPRDSSQAVARDRRYASAVFLLMQACFGTDMPLRVVRGVDGSDWTVLPIREGWRWDPEIEMRRRDWLCCVTTGDRRYISPVPAGWEQWTDTELATAIRQAKPDLRGPR
jgi:hypothetical protein